ncbi:MAG: silent information regulator protein Sir2 [Planctomycetia bacterium]|nr:silent information regulator protein Sir2 [Planctomycetia bacterium]
MKRKFCCVLFVLSLFPLLSVSLIGQEAKEIKKVASLPEIKTVPSAKEVPLSESPWADWTFGSGDKKKAECTWITEGSKGKEGHLRIVYDGNDRWWFSSPKIPVGKDWNAINAYTWARARKGDYVYISLYTWRGKSSAGGRCGGTLIPIESSDWTHLLATGPGEGAEYYQITINGKGASDIDLAPTTVFSCKPFAKEDFHPFTGYAKKRVDEKLDRGVIAIASKEGAYLGWRLLKDDPKEIAFNIYRREKDKSSKKLNDSPLAATTDFVDKDAKAGTEYTWVIRPVLNGKETGEKSSTSLVIPQNKKEYRNYISLPLRDKDEVSRISLADLNGDGKLDYIVKKGRSIVDPYHKPGYWKKSLRTISLDAYLSDGTFLWTYDFGWSIEQGIWYSPILVYDLDGDGKAEVVAKAGVGDPRDGTGRVHSTEEYLIILNGETGKEIARAPWASRDGFSYNYASRNFLCIAYLDGKTPFLVSHRGTYNMMRTAFYQFHDGKLEMVHQWSNCCEFDKQTWGQGAHRMHAADVDNDGFEEICVGSFVFDHDGSILWSLGLGHPDHMFVGDLNPNNPGMEIYLGLESRNKKNGMCMLDAATGKYLWAYDGPTWHIHASGLCSDIDPRYPGYECFGGESKTPNIPETRYLWTADGKLLAKGLTEKEVGVPGLGTGSVWWDATLQRALLVRKKEGDLMKLQYPKQEFINERLPGTVLLTGDFFGDWREEVISFVPGEIRIYTTSIPAADRRVSLIQDRNYRATTIENMVGYTSTPAPSYDLKKK